MRISIFGLGYVGCVSAACLADAGHEIIGVDINDEKVALINAGSSPIIESGLEDLLKKVVGAGRLRATSSSQSAIDSSDMAMICVGTPGHANGKLNLDTLKAVCAEIGRALAAHPRLYTVVVRSTMLPGTLEQVITPALHVAAGERAASLLKVAVNPEFMCEGTALQDFQHPPFTLVGSEDAETASRVSSLYASVDAPVVHTQVKTAEMLKYACNAFHAMKVCFANEIGDVCVALGADSQEVMRIFRMDHKLNISGAYLRPGFAFGGSCLPKDVRALAYAARSADVETRLLASIVPSNEMQIQRTVELVLATHKRRIGIASLAFKPGTDDLRESPMVTLVETLIGKGCDVRILDHNVSVARLVGANRRYIEEEIPHIASLMCNGADELLAHAEVLVIGNASADMQQVLADAKPGQIVIDLTRGAAQPLVGYMPEGAESCQPSKPKHSSPQPVQHSLSPRP